MDCITPSHTTKIPHGESLDIHALLAKGAAACKLDESISPVNPPTVDRFEYTPRQPVMASLQPTDLTRAAITLLKAQITPSDKELRDIIKDHRKDSTPTMDSTAKASTFRSRPASGLHLHARPQAVELPDIGTMLGGHDFSKRRGKWDGKPWVYEKHGGVGVRTRTYGT